MRSGIEDMVVAVECLFTWYWLADLCAPQGLPFVLGHALSMTAIHGDKAKNDRIDARKIAVLLRGGILPKRRCCACAPILRASSTWPAWRKNMGRARP